MAQDLNDAVNRLQEMLSSETGKQELQDMVSSLGGGEMPSMGEQSTGGQSMSGLPAGLNLELLGKMQGIMNEMQNGNDARSNLLQALTPYLSNSRAGHVQSAMRLMNLGKLPAILKNLRG